jgi:hypothetical protein
MKLFILGIVVFLVQSSFQLPVKEAATEKDPKAATPEDSNQQNLENIIGETFQELSCHLFYVTSRLFLDCSNRI